MQGPESTTGNIVVRTSLSQQTLERRLIAKKEELCGFTKLAADEDIRLPGCSG
jgi:hypothetical protein